MFTGKTSAEAEAPIPWPPDAKTFFGKDPDTRKRLRARGEGSYRG